MGCLIHKINQVLKRFAGTFCWAQTSYLWRVKMYVTVFFSFQLLDVWCVCELDLQNSLYCVSMCQFDFLALDCICVGVQIAYWYVWQCSSDENLQSYWYEPDMHGPNGQNVIIWRVTRCFCGYLTKFFEKMPKSPIFWWKM